jgi:hypothetical protein
MYKSFKKDLNKPGGRAFYNKNNEQENEKNPVKWMKPAEYNDKFFDCYSVKLNDFLKSNRLEPVKEKRHQKTNKIAFVYEKTKKLDELLTVWSNNREKNGVIKDEH